jgi:hypothetical protein
MWLETNGELTSWSSYARSNMKYVLFHLVGTSRMGHLSAISGPERSKLAFTALMVDFQSSWRCGDARMYFPAARIYCVVGRV